MPKSKKTGRKPRVPPLTPKQRRFVAEYLLDLNATQAAVRSGYSKKTAEVQGSRLLRNARIAAGVAEGQKDRADRTGITQDRVLEELALLAFSDVTHYLVDDDGNVSPSKHAPPGAMRALQSIKRRITTRGTGEKTETVIDVEVKLWDKPGPLELAGQHVGLFTKKHEHSGPNGGPIPVAQHDLSKLSTDEIRQLFTLTKKIQPAEAR